MLGWMTHLVLAAAMTSPAAPAADVTQALRAKDQALLDAIAPGDVKLWDATVASNFVYVDENGVVMDRAEFLKQLQPLPKGASGTLEISKYSVELSGDVATVVHQDDEHENYHGQKLFAQYLQTETWQKQEGNWKLLMVHCYTVLQQPKTITLPAGELDAYVGKYSAAPDLIYTIRREGDHLVGQREGRTAAPLQAEVRDVFFVSGQLRVRKIFERDAQGKVVGFTDRREGQDLVWKRVE
jgi:ketosteroid isomerase-like protein